MNPESEERSFDELVVRYWDGTLDESGLAELNAILTARPELRAAFNDHSLQTLAISEHLAAEKACTPTRLGILRFGRRRLLVGSAAAAGILATAALKLSRWWPFTPSEDPDDSTIARLEEAAGTIYLAEPGREERTIEVNQPLKMGQVISTVGLSSSARIRCADGTYLVLGENASATLLDDKIQRIRLDRGGLAAAVGARAEDKPLRILTADRSEIQARGAKLWLESSQTQTRVVHRTEPAGSGQGTVQLKRLSDGQAVPIQPGQWAVASAEGKLRPEIQPTSPDNWSIDFGPELPPGWEVGKLVFDDLPEGSQAAVLAMPFRQPRGRTFHKVQSHKDWTNGLFTIHDDTWLHVRFRVDKPGFFHILVVARDPDATRRLTVVLEGPDVWSRREARRWYTADVPFARFRPTRPESRLDKPLIAFLVLFDSQGVDRGLTIERFWVTRGPEKL